ncbi:MAG: helix-turn-helix transcriptional regulator [Clostridia bacterium]|nr:helix-turn-helix transcriptional regulator [Clostridia bacterium]
MSFNETKHHGTESLPIELYCVDISHPKYEMAFHWHSAIEIIRVRSGRLDVTLNSRTTKAEAGDILVVNSETVHGATPYDCVYDCIVFHPEEFIADENGCRPFIEQLLDSSVLLYDYFKASSDTVLEGIIAETVKALQERKQGYKFSATGLIYCFFAHMINNEYYAQNTRPTPERDVIRLKIALRYIREKFDTDLKLSDIAEKVSMSPKYFCRFFKDMTGKTPIEYLLAYRIERAARRLASGNETITEVSFACGFSDLSYFTKMFKRYRGTTPSRFKRDHME